MTEHSLKLEKGEILGCSSCWEKIEGPVTVQLIADPWDDEGIAEVLCQKCSDKRGE
jgi:hypothetical protein